MAEQREWHADVREYAEKHTAAVGEPLDVVVDSRTAVVQVTTRGLLAWGATANAVGFMPFAPLLHPDDDMDAVGEQEQPTVDNSAAEDMDARAEANSGNNVPENVMLA